MDIQSFSFSNPQTKQRHVTISPYDYDLMSLMKMIPGWTNTSSDGYLNAQLLSMIYDNDAMTMGVDKITGAHFVPEEIIGEMFRFTLEFLNDV